MVDKKPRVSLGMLIYNGDRFLQEILDSIVSQTLESQPFWVCPFLRVVELGCRDGLSSS